MRKASHVSVDYNAFVSSERVAEDDIRSFAADAGKFAQLSHCVRHLAGMPVGDCFRRRADALGFVAKKSRGANRAFQLRLRRAGVIGCGFVLGEERRRDEVHPLIGTLRRENRRDQELQWIAEIKFAMRAGINLRKNFDKFGDTFPCGH